MAKKNPVSETTDIAELPVEPPAPPAEPEPEPVAAPVEPPAPPAEPIAEAKAEPSSPSDPKLERAKAMFPEGGTFNLPGNSNAFTVLGEPELVDGAVHVMCQKHTGHRGLICVESML